MNRPNKQENLKTESRLHEERPVTCWLIKTEADCYSIDDLRKDRETPWAGVRNFQARNFMRDLMRVGDLALFYHSSSTKKNNPNGVYGIARVASKAYPDPTAFDPKGEHYDSSQDQKRKLDEASHPSLAKEGSVSRRAKSAFVPTWMLVDFSFVKKFDMPVTLAELKDDPMLDGMMVRQTGSRLSIQPVSERHFNYIVTKAQ